MSLRTPAAATALAAALLLPAFGCTASGDRAVPGAGAAADTTAAGPPAPPAVPPDLARFPMPDHPAGAERVHGEITSVPSLPGAPDTLLVAREEDLLHLTARGLVLNCCTEKLRAGAVAAGGTLQVHLYQYLPDVCECTHRRDVALVVAPPPDVSRVLLYLDAGATPVREAVLTP